MREVPDDRPPETPPDELLGGRYRLGQQVGSGGFAVTYRGEDVETGEAVAVKELAIERVEDWKSVELFERESDVLRRLDHPGIPEYVDAFSVEDAGAGTVRHYLVQEFVDGRDLRGLLRDGESFDEDEVREFLAKLLEILAYLHDRKPPVVHRDVKPSNILRTAEGDWALVDFGVVQQVWTDTVGGSTFVGTSGYMPPEQAAGRADPASDIYALGATAVELLSGRPPGDFPTADMKIRFRGLLDISDPLAELLEQMLEPVPEDRLADASAALDALRGLAAADPASALPVHKPGEALVSGSTVTREVTSSGHLKVRVPVDTLIEFHNPLTNIYRWAFPVGFVAFAALLAVQGYLSANYGLATFGAMTAAALLYSFAPGGLDREIQLELAPDSFRMTRLRGWPGSSRRTTDSLYGETKALRMALLKKIEYGERTPSVDDHLPASEALDWLVVERLETREAEALYNAITELEET